MAKTAILSVRILGDAKGARQAMGETETAAGKLGGVMGKVGGVVAAGAAVAGTALAALGVAGVKAAGDLEQSVGAVDSVFKGQADVMHQYADAAATAVGLTKNEYNELATVLGTQLKNGGTAMDELGGKTNDLMVLGADLASMFGGTTADAVGALSSALKGERDPIERFGVSLNQAAVDAKAAELGFQKVGGALSTEANQAATLALIMDQTADAHGNFGRETNTFAGQVSILTAQWGNFVATLGTALLPILTTVLGFITSQVMPGLQSFAEVIGPVIADALAQLGPALQGMLPSLMSLVSAGTPVTALFEALVPHLGLLGEAFAGLVPAIAELAVGIMPLIAQAFSTLVPVVLQLAATILPMILGVFTQMIPVILQIAQTVLPLILTAFSTLMPVVMQLVSAVLPPLLGLIPLVGEAFLTLVEAVAPLIPLVADMLIPVIQAIAPLLMTVVQVLTGILGPALQVVIGIVQAVVGVLTGDWAAAWEGVKTITTGAINLVKGIISGAMKLIGAIITTGLALVAAQFGNAWNSITAGARTAASNLGSAISSGIDTAVSFVSSLPGRIKSALGNVGALLKSSGLALMKGFANGITSGITNAVNAAKGALNRVRDFFPFSPAKRGPFAGRGYTTYSGAALVSDFAKAMIRQTRAVRNAAGTVAQAAYIDPRAPRLSRLTVPSALMNAQQAGPRETHVHVHIDGAFIGDRVSLAREIRAVFDDYADVMGRPA